MLVQAERSLARVSCDVVFWPMPTELRRPSGIVIHAFGAFFAWLPWLRICAGALH